MTPTIGIVALCSSNQRGNRRPRGSYQLLYDTPRNQEAMTKTMTETTSHRVASEPPPCLQCHNGQHSSTMPHHAVMWPQDHDDNHAWTCTTRWHSLQAKLARPFLRLSTLRSGEPPLCISPGLGLYIRVVRAPISGMTFTSSTIPFIHHCSGTPRASLQVAPRLA